MERHGMSTVEQKIRRVLCPHEGKVRVMSVQ